jgi:4-aminobutyrate aminotransferase
MRVEEKASAADVLAARDRYVPRGISASDLVVARAWGARIWDADGREYLDFAGGIACQNLGHGPAGVVRAVHEQVDRYLHQCFMVGVYEPYVEVCRRLDELWPGEAATKSILLNSGAEAIENAVKIARTATGRPGVVVFDRAFHGRTTLTMAMTSKLVYKQGFGPLAPAVYRAPAPYPYRGVTTEDALAGLDLLFKQDVDPGEVACMVLEPVQGEGGFIPMPAEFVRALKERCERHGILYVDDEVQSGCGRTGTVWAIERLDVEPDLIVGGKTLGGGLPLASVTGKSSIMDAVHPGGLGGTFGGNPVACAAALAVLATIADDHLLDNVKRVGEHLAHQLESLDSPLVTDVRGSGLWRALALSGTHAQAVEAAARSRGLLVNAVKPDAIRLAPPLILSETDVDEAIPLLTAALGDVGA